MKPVYSLFWTSILLLFLFSCEKKSMDLYPDITGTWELQRSESYFFRPGPGESGPRIQDFRGENILFHFGPDSILTISGMSDSTYFSFSKPTYAYSFRKDYLNNYPEEAAEKIWLVIIEEVKWTYHFVPKTKEMTLSTAYFDGPALIFKRIKP